MATTFMSKVIAYRKKHKGMSMPEAMKALSSANKKAPVKKAAVKKAVVKKSISGTKKAAPKKVVIRVNKKGAVKATIGNVALTKVGVEQNYLKRLESDLDALKSKLKVKGILASEKAAVNRVIAKTKEAMRISKAHIQQLKKLL